ncbi:MAG: NAD(P)H-dependent oxidoreductase [Hyphomicrobiales bacterium]
MLLEKLNWRYATKQMDATKTVPDDKLNKILEAINIAPTSSGLQPFEIIVVTDKKIKAQLKEVGFDQSQFVDGSHIIIFAAWDNYTENRIDSFVELMAKERGGISEGLTAYYANIKNMYLPRPEQVNFEHAARQTYIALGFGLVAAAFEEVDATPMEGFIPAKVDEILGLSARGLKSTSIIALGYRDVQKDWLAPLKKVRRPLSEIVTRLD